jgi:hypothetical protein
MDTEKHEKAPLATSEALAETVSNLTTDQVRFVVARQECGTDKEAAEAIHISPETVKGWKQKGAPIDDAVRLMARDGVVVATELRRRNLAKAMAVKVAGLDSGREATRQNVATEIIEWEMGRATQKQELTGADGGPVVVEHDLDADTIREALAILGTADSR